MNLLDTTDWSLTEVEIDSSGPDWQSAYCFSADEKTFYCFNRKNKSVVVHDLSNDKSKEYPLGSAVSSDALDGSSAKIRFQISKDNKTLYITSVINDVKYLGSYYVFFSTATINSARFTCWFVGKYPNLSQVRRKRNGPPAHERDEYNVGPTRPAGSDP